MSRGMPESGDREQDIFEFALRERILRDTWLSFKIKLRADKQLEPECAVKKYLEEEAKFEEELKWLNEDRKKVVAHNASFPPKGQAKPTIRARNIGDFAPTGVHI